MFKFFRRALFVALALSSFSQAFATVDVFMKYSTIRESFHTSSKCFFDTHMWAEIGIPTDTVASALLDPTYVLRKPIGFAPRAMNINVLSTSSAKANYLFDNYNEETQVTHAGFELDLRQLATENGNSRAGRQKTIDFAKLYLLAFNRSLSLLMPDKYKLSVSIIGLPSQVGLNGTTVYPTTHQPYTQGSPLLKAYEKEVINTDGGCDDSF